MLGMKTWSSLLQNLSKCRARRPSPSPWRGRGGGPGMELLGRAAHPAWLADLGLPPGHARPPRRGACHLVFLSTQKRSRSIYFFKVEKPHLPVCLATPGARPGSNGETMEKAADFVRGQPGLHQPCRGLRCHGQLATWDGSVNPGLAPLCQQETRGLRSRNKKWVGGFSSLLHTGGDQGWFKLCFTQLAPFPSCASISLGPPGPPGGGTVSRL